MTQQSLNTVQNEVSTGLSVSTAADNSSYWSIAAQLNADSGVVTAADTALSQGQSTLDTASSAISSVITTINSIQTALTEATNPGANIGNINTSLASLGQQLLDSVKGASYNGINVLNGSQVAAAMTFVSGFNASATGGTMNTISFTTQALYGLTSGGANPTETTSQSTVTDAPTIAQLKTQFAADAADTTAVTAGTITATYGTDAIYADTTNQAFTVQSMALDGTATTTTYTALDANGNTLAQEGTGGALTFANAASYAVTTTITTPAAASQNLLVQGGLDLTNLSVTAGTAQAALTATNNALSAVTTYAAQIGATQDRMTSASTFNSPWSPTTPTAWRARSTRI
jgi:flagellin